jgi:hypothetical protein
VVTCCSAAPMPPQRAGPHALSQCDYACMLNHCGTRLPRCRSQLASSAALLPAGACHVQSQSGPDDCDLVRPLGLARSCRLCHCHVVASSSSHFRLLAVCKPCGLLACVWQPRRRGWFPRLSQQRRWRWVRARVCASCSLHMSSAAMTAPVVLPPARPRAHVPVTDSCRSHHALLCLPLNMMRSRQHGVRKHPVARGRIRRVRRRRVRRAAGRARHVDTRLQPHPGLARTLYV